MAKYLEKAMLISIFKSKQCKLAPTVTVLDTHNFACTNMHAKLFYMQENPCTQILNLASPDEGKRKSTISNRWEKEEAGTKVAEEIHHHQLDVILQK